jgi:hypothetical protein
VKDGYPFNPSDAYYDNIPGDPVLVKFSTVDGTFVFTAGNVKTVTVIARDVVGNFVAANTTVISPVELTPNRVDVVCQFTVTVIPSYTPGAPEAVLSAVFIRKFASQKFGAYLEISTGMAWPHRRYCDCSCDVQLCALHSVHADLTINIHLHTRPGLLDLVYVDAETDPRRGAEVFANCESGVADTTDPYYQGQTCIQKFGITVEFPEGR